MSYEFPRVDGLNKHLIRLAPYARTPSFHDKILVMQDNGTGVILEDINGKMDTVLEAVGQMQDQIKVLPAMQSDLREVKDDVKVIKEVVTNHSRQLDDFESRITHLETA